MSINFLSFLTDFFFPSSFQLIDNTVKFNITWVMYSTLSEFECNAQKGNNIWNISENIVYIIAEDKMIIF